MSLILAIEPDLRQSLTLTSLSRARLNCELVTGETVPRAFEALGSRRPDLVLTSPRLTPQDLSMVESRLRVFEAAGPPVPRMVVPPLGVRQADKKRTRGSRPKGGPGVPTSVDPLTFSDQIAECLEMAAAERAALAAAQAELEAAWASEPATKTAAAADLTALADCATSVADASAQLAEAEVLPDDPSATLVPAPSWAVVANDADVLQIDAAPAQLTATCEVAASDVAAPDAPETGWEELRIEGASSEADEALSESGAFTVEAEPLDLRFDFDRLGRELEAPPTVPAEPACDAATADPVATENQPTDAERDRTPSLDEAAVVSSTSLDEPPELPPTVTALEAAAAEEAAGTEIETRVGVPTVVPVASTVPEERASDETDEPSAAPMLTTSDPTPASGWQDVLSAIRRDIQQLRGEDQAARPPAQIPAIDPPAPVAAEAPEEADHGHVTVSGPQQHQPVVWRTTPRPRAISRVVPVQDEWGFFDPQQCGFEALRAKLQAMIDLNAASQ